MKRVIHCIATGLALLAPLLTLACGPVSESAAQATPTIRQAQTEVSDPFERTWARTDLPVADGTVDRTWIWGPRPVSAELGEAYVDNPVGRRAVLYYDKARMEINDPAADASADWYVTNGLLVVELTSGRVQVGNDTFLQHAPADLNVAGDLNDADGVTYATLARLENAEPLATGTTITQRVQRAGNVTDDPSLAARGVTAGPLNAATGHTVATPFWDFLNADGPIWDGAAVTDGALFANPFYATGLPISEAYWTTVSVDGVVRDVLLQCFERRCLTYTPDNAAGWQVEAGNVGLHYYQWRYETLQVGVQRDFPVALNDLPAATVEGSTLRLEVVSSSETTRCGLMHRLNLPDDQAMLFIFGSDSSGGFWNRNTFVPLTLAWLASDGEVVGFTEMAAATPGQPQDPISYAAPGVYRYVIEANQGWFSTQGVEIGDVVDVSAAVATGEATPYSICEVLGY